MSEVTRIDVKRVQVSTPQGELEFLIDLLEQESRKLRERAAGASVPGSGPPLSDEHANKLAMVAHRCLAVHQSSWRPDEPRAAG